MNDLLAAGPDHLAGYLLVAALLFGLGLLACVTRRNMIGYLMGLELMLNAASLNFVAFGRFLGHGQSEGQVVSMFIIALAACEAVVALAFGYCVYRTFKDVDLDAMNTLKG